MRATEREHDRGKVGRGIAVRERAAQRAAVAHLRVADLVRGVREQRHLRVQELGGLELVMTHE